ncbi:hypothetical protein [Pseudonocardia sp. ICBG1142]|uniref:hypothetical protein n=1 Tax=Pseudonocardia sp. ICBG1142 TaxID=2846760 RepID=UPI001CF6EC22|nr:hypothetical protein [Pseudonocardia sp. ICBG1142]
MNALLHRAVTAVQDRAVEITVAAALTGMTVWLTWWCAGPLGVVTGWWIAAELRLWQVRRTAPASTERCELPAADAVSDGPEPPSERVPAGQPVEGRAGA